MPNIVAHYIVGKLVERKLHFDNSDYLKGNLYPDYIDVTMHYRILGNKFEVPDINKFITANNFSNNYFKVGFLTHLLLDKLFLDEFVINHIYDKIDDKINIFESDKIYLDYTNISKRLLRHYHMNIIDIDKLMLNEDIDISKYIQNTDVIKLNKHGKKPHYLSINDFTSFLDEAAIRISNYIENNNLL